MLPTGSASGRRWYSWMQFYSAGLSKETPCSLRNCREIVLQIQLGEVPRGILCETRSPRRTYVIPAQAQLCIRDRHRRRIPKGSDRVKTRLMASLRKHYYVAHGHMNLIDIAAREASKKRVFQSVKTSQYLKA